MATADGAGKNSRELVLKTTGKDQYPSSAFFYDAGDFAAEWPDSNVNNDWLAIGTVKNTVQIASIDYSSNTISLASPMTWADGASVWLYKNSQGEIVLRGSAPDYGASEY